MWVTSKIYYSITYLKYQKKKVYVHKEEKFSLLKEAMKREIKLKKDYKIMYVILSEIIERHKTK